MLHFGKWLQFPQAKYLEIQIRYLFDAQNIQNVLTDRKRVPRIYCSVLSLVSVEIIIPNHFGPLLREGRCTFGSVITLLVC